MGAFASADNPIRIQSAPLAERLHNLFTKAAIDMIGMACLPIAALTGHYAPVIYVAQPSATFESAIRIANSANGQYHDIFMTDSNLAIRKGGPENVITGQYHCNPYGIRDVRLNGDASALEFLDDNGNTILVGEGLEVAQLYAARRAINDTLNAWKNHKFESRFEI